MPTQLPSPPPNLPVRLFGPKVVQPWPTLYDVQYPPSYCRRGDGVTFSAKGMKDPPKGGGGGRI